ncbi:NACHT domain-containing protein [Nocardia brasiliensis]
MRARSRWKLLAAIAIALVALGVAAVVSLSQIRGAEIGEVDPAALAVALVSLAASVWFGHRSVALAQTAQGIADSDVNGQAARLARLVMSAETATRAELLGREANAIDLVLTMHLTPGHNPDNALPESDLTAIVAYYQALHPRRLLITGAAGAGKTVLATELVIGLIEARSGDTPVPVRLNANTWNTEKNGVDQWLVMQLVANFELGEAAARALVEARMIVPVIDGLDEMDYDGTLSYTSRAATAVRLVNAYQHGSRRAQVILTCRTPQYRQLETMQVWIRDAARLEIAPVNVARARQFLLARVTSPVRWQPVLTALSDPGGSVSAILSTPWRLTLAVTVYEQRREINEGPYVRDIDELLRAAQSGADSFRDHLLALLIPATCGSFSRAPYSPEEVCRWLSILAQQVIPISKLRDLALESYPLPGRNAVVLRIILATAITYLISSSALVISSTIVLVDSSWEEVGQYIGVAEAALGLMILPSAIATRWRLSKYPPSAYPIWWNWVLLLSWVAQLGGMILLAYLLKLPVYKTQSPPWVHAVVVAFVAFVVLVDTESTWYWYPDRSELGTILSSRSETYHNWLRGLSVRTVLFLAAWAYIGSPQAVAVAIFLFPTAVCRGEPWRYLCLLLGTRRGWSSKPLPWRLMRFLNWCHDARLLRTAGVAYQFRHREFQEYLSRDPHSP